MKKRRVFAGIGGVLLVGATLAWVASIPVAESLSRPQVAASAGAQAHGAAAFAGAGFGGISTDALATNAVPWRIVAAALVLDERQRNPSAPASRATLDTVLARFGFLTGAQISNLPAGVAQPGALQPHAVGLPDSGWPRRRARRRVAGPSHLDGLVLPHRLLAGVPAVALHHLERRDGSALGRLRHPDSRDGSPAAGPRSAWAQRHGLELAA